MLKNISLLIRQQEHSDSKIQALAFERLTRF